MDINWDELRKLLETRFALETYTLLTCEGERVTGVHQGRAQVLRDLLHLPDLLVQERELDKLEREAREAARNRKP